MTQEIDPPPGAPSDWATVVHRTTLGDLERLEQWTGRGETVDRGTPPSGHFQPVGRHSLGGGGGAIYVLVHGWAPGYRTAVETAKGRIHWWGPKAVAGGVWASDWGWCEVVSTGGVFTDPVTVNPTGVLQQIYAVDPTATILAFSWIDDSATAGLGFSIPAAYASEAYTHLNGIRLANALEDAIDPAFFAAKGRRLHLIGHSHGSKVCTVAAKTLADRTLPATDLTILDPPDWWPTRVANAANLLGFHLDQLDIRDPLTTGDGLYVESYTSCFGVTYASDAPSSPIHNVVDVLLHPSQTYLAVDFGDEHTYAAAWYGGAAAGARERGRPKVGLDWPPPPQQHSPSMVQRWRGKAADQWTLAPAPTHNVCRFSTAPLTIDEVFKSPGVSAGGGTITFAPVPKQAYSTFQGRYAVTGLGQYGLAFDLTWARPSPDTLFVVCASWETAAGRAHETVQVLDGGSIRPGETTSIGICADPMDDRHPLVEMYYLSDPASPYDKVTLSDIRSIHVT